jgi:hypothetical protein
MKSKFSKNYEKISIYIFFDKIIAILFKIRTEIIDFF